MAEDSPLLRMTSITKDFPGMRALDNVDFDLYAGEVHCLVGENGAGKSTLVKIISGVYAKDSGQILLGGKETEITSARQARELGINAIYQEPELFPYLTVAENIFLGIERTTKTGMVNWRETYRQAAAVSERLGVKLDLRARVGDLSLANRQLVAIAKALASFSQIVIMDEPSAILSGSDLQQLYKIVRVLREQGVGIVYISHNLSEIFEIGDRLTVLRDGKLVATSAPKLTTIDEVVHWMVGRDLKGWLVRDKVESGKTILSVRDLGRRGVFSDVSFDLHEREVLGFAGLAGAGRSEVMRCLVGEDRADAGTVAFRGKDFRPGSPRQALKRGLALVPEDRKKDGIVACRSVAENISLSVLDRLSRLLIINAGKIAEVVRSAIEQFGIKTPTASKAVGELSGGNQQKVILARCLATKPDCIILDEPTRGVDVGTKAEIHKLLGDLVKQNMACILVSSELPEILALSDRILVMADGRITKELFPEQTTQEEVLSYAIPGGTQVSTTG
jgi:ribose transport system ATP-binding protein